MKPRLKSTRAARDLIKAHEPFIAEARRRGRRWVVGYGHSAAAKAGVSITPENAELLLIYDVLQAEQAVESAAGRDLPAPMRDALVSFAASVGANAFKVSDVARLTRAGKHREAAAALETWVRAEEDGRLVVSERLARRRAAEKALYLSALDNPPDSGSDRQVDNARDEQPDPAAPSPDLAPKNPDLAPSEPDPAPRTLVELDIAFEDFEPEAEAAPEPAVEPAPGPDTAPEPEPESGHADAALSPEPDTPAEPDPTSEPAPAPESEPAQTSREEDDAARSAQDAAVQAVLARMASAMSAEPARPATAADAGPEPEAQPEPAQPEPAPTEPAEPQPAPSAATVRGDAILGFSFLTPAVVSAPVSKPAPASPAASAPASVQPEPSFRVPDLAPPHPGEAPARAPGLSGEADGPERPEGEPADSYHEDDAVLEPAHVAGVEAALPAPGEAGAKASGRGGIVIFVANLCVGLAMTGLGAADLIANFDSYMAEGIGANFVGPGVFAAGVLLSVASAWTLAGRLTEGRSKRA
ncbi:MAG: glycoside hydrolase family protein [Oceanicaulis sp.]|nr:glycoside hydrolase family protein [Oceanicaulis sp.]